MKIVFITSVDPAQGAPHHLMAALWLSRLGLRPLCLCKGEGAYGAIDTPMGPVETLPLAMPQGPLGRFLWQGKLMAKLLALRMRMGKEALFYVNGSVACPAAWIGLQGVPPARRIYHTQDYLEPSRHPLRAFFEKKVAEKAGTVICNEVNRGRFMASHYRLKRMPVVLPTALPKCWPMSGFDREKRARLLRKTGIRLRPKMTLILHQGPYSPVRCSPQLLRAFRMLPENFCLLFTGMTEAEARLKSWVDLSRDARLRSRLGKLPPLPFNELLAVTALCDIGLLLYPNDGIGNFYQAPGRLTEYLGSGVPVVASRFPGLELLVLKYALGELCDPDSPDDIAQAILRVKTGGAPAQRRRLKGLFNDRFCYDANAPVLEGAMARAGGAACGGAMELTPSPMADFLLLAMLGVVTGHAMHLKSRGRLMGFDPLFTFWAGFLICYFQQPISNGPLFIQWQGEKTYCMTLACALMAAITVVAGYENSLGPRLAAKIPVPPPRLDPFRLSAAGFILLGLGLTGYYYLFQSAGGAAEWLSYGRGGTDYASVNGYVAELEKFTPLGAFLILIHVNVHPVSPLKKLFGWALIAVLALWYLYLGTRSRLILMALMMGSAWYLPRRKSPSLAVLALGFLCLFVLTRFQENYRHTFTDLSFHLDELNLDDAKALCLPGILGGDPQRQHRAVSPGIDFNVAMNVVKLVPSRVPFNYGWGFLEFLTRPIPRSIWPDKIYPGMESWQGVLREGGLSTAYVRDRNLLMGPAFTFIAYWYYILGPISLVLGGLYTGVLLRTIREFWDQSPGSESALILYTCVLIIGFDEAASTPFNWIFDLPLTIFLPLTLLLRLCAPSKDSPAANRTAIRSTP